MFSRRISSAESERAVRGFRADSELGFLIPDDLHDDLEESRDIERAVESLRAERDSDAPAKKEQFACVESARARNYYSKVSATVSVFDTETLSNLIKASRIEDSDRTRRILADLESAQAFQGLRHLPEMNFDEIIGGLHRVKDDMPNFAEVIDILTGELAISMTVPCDDFRVSPLCLDGSPGIGKTRFAREVARVLNVGFEAISLGAAGGGFELSGVPSGYSNAKSGRIWRLLAEGDYACPVVLLDEVDKMAGDERFPTMPVLLDLLESDSAAKFRDEALEARCDASKMICLLTSNEADLIPRPLESRMRMIEIKPPTIEQRRKIADRIASEFLRLGVEFRFSVIDDLAEVDMDLRALRRFLREAAGRALADGKDFISSDDVTIPTKPAARQMGFA